MIYSGAHRLLLWGQATAFTTYEETVDLQENLDVTISKLIAESPVFTETFQARRFFEQLLSESVSLTEALAATSPIQLFLTDTMKLTETFSRRFIRRLADTIGFTESMTIPDVTQQPALTIDRFTARQHDFQALGLPTPGEYVTRIAGSRRRIFLPYAESQFYDFYGTLSRFWTPITTELVVIWAPEVATSGTIRWELAFERWQHRLTDVDPIDPVFTNFVLGDFAVLGGQGVIQYSSFFLTPANLNGISIGESYVLRVQRAGLDSGMTGRALLLGVELLQRPTIRTVGAAGIIRNLGPGLFGPIPGGFIPPVSGGGGGTGGGAVGGGGGGTGGGGTGGGIIPPFPGTGGGGTGTGTGSTGGNGPGTATPPGNLEYILGPLTTYAGDVYDTFMHDELLHWANQFLAAVTTQINQGFQYGIPAIFLREYYRGSPDGDTFRAAARAGVEHYRDGTADFPDSAYDPTLMQQYLNGVGNASNFFTPFQQPSPQMFSAYVIDHPAGEAAAARKCKDIVRLMAGCMFYHQNLRVHFIEWGHGVRETGSVGNWAWHSILLGDGDTVINMADHNGSFTRTPNQILERVIENLVEHDQVRDGWWWDLGSASNPNERYVGNMNLCGTTLEVLCRVDRWKRAHGIVDPRLINLIRRAIAWLNTQWVPHDETNPDTLQFFHGRSFRYYFYEFGHYGENGTHFFTEWPLSGHLIEPYAYKYLRDGGEENRVRVIDILDGIIRQKIETVGAAGHYFDCRQASEASRTWHPGRALLQIAADIPIPPIIPPPAPEPPPTPPGTLPPAPTNLHPIEGFGAATTGGFGQQVVHVTNTNDSGPGSLRNALSFGDRYIVFDVGGTINAGDHIELFGNNITIDFLSAPAPITVRGYGFLLVQNNNVYIRDARIEDMSGEHDMFSIIQSTFVVLDHCSMINKAFSGGVSVEVGDGAFDVKDGSRNITVQWCLLGVGKQSLIATSTTSENMVARVSVHHCGYLSVIDTAGVFGTPNGGYSDRSPLNRMPGFSPVEITLDFRHNIVSFPIRANCSKFQSSTWANCVGNSYIPAPATSINDREDSISIDGSGVRLYTAGNRELGTPALAFNINSVGNEGSPFEAPGLTPYTLLEVFQQVGPRFPRSAYEQERLNLIASFSPF